MDYFDCVFRSTNDLAQPIWCSHCFHDFSIATPGRRGRRAWNLMGTSVRNERRFFLLFMKNYYFTERLYAFLLITFRNIFQTFKSNRLITLLSNCMWNSNAKKVFKLLEKVFSSLWVHFFPRYLHVLAYEVYLN